MLEPNSSPSPDRPLSASYPVILSGLVPANPDDMILLALGAMGFQPVVAGGVEGHEGLGVIADEGSSAASPCLLTNVPKSMRQGTHNLHAEPEVTRSAASQVRLLSAKWLSTLGTRRFYSVFTVTELLSADEEQRPVDQSRTNVRITTPETKLFYGEHAEGRGDQTSSWPKVASPDESLYLGHAFGSSKK